MKKSPYVRVTREQRAAVIDETKLYRNPKAQGRDSFLGRLVIFLVDHFPHICLTLTPALLMQYLYCYGGSGSGSMLPEEEYPNKNNPPQVGITLDEVFCPTTRPPFLSGLLIFLSIESVFYIAMSIKLAYLQSMDPLEASLKTSGILSKEERQYAWETVMEAEASDVAAYFENWFFGKKMKEISINEIRDFVAFTFFECRNQEHLTDGEHKQLDAFMEDALTRIQKQQQQQQQQGLEGDENATGSSIRNPKSVLRPTVSRLTVDPSDFSKNPKDWETLQVQRRLLQQLVPQAHNVPAAQLAQVMRNITMIHQHVLEQQQQQQNNSHHPKDLNHHRLSMDSTVSSSSLLSSSAAPSSSDPLKTPKAQAKSRNFGFPIVEPIHGVRILPLFFQLTVFLVTEIVLRIILWRNGFQRHHAVGTTYFFHPGRPNSKKSNDNTTTTHEEDHGDTKLPIVFMHGLGIGHIYYLPLIFQMLKAGRPIFLPEIASVSACRPWIFPGSVQTPHHVAASLSTMLSRHSFPKATFAGHSFGTLWMAYMTKYAPGYVAALVFLDPICFSFHKSHLSQRTIYNDVDPGDMSFMVFYDMMVNWSIQRVSGTRGNLTVRDLRGKPCVAFLSEMDRLAPSAMQQTYLRERGATVFDFDHQMTKEDYMKKKDMADLSAVIFRGADHGDWAHSATAPRGVVECMETLCTRAEEMERKKAQERRQSDDDHYSLRSSTAIITSGGVAEDRYSARSSFSRRSSIAILFSGVESLGTPKQNQRALSARSLFS